MIRDFVLGLTDVNAAHTCRQWLKIHTPRVLNVEVGIARDSTCNSCKDWLLAQWEAFNTKRSHTDGKKSSNRHAGAPTSLTSESLSSSAPVKQAASSLAPPPLSAPPPSEGPGIREETKSDKPKLTRVSSSPPLLASQQGESGGDTNNELTEEGNTPPLPPPPSIWRREGWTPAPLSHLPYHLRLCSRLGLTATLLTPTRGPTKGVR